MKTRFHLKLLPVALVSLWLIHGCASMYGSNDTPTSKASPEATAAITSASSAIKAAKANNWIWRDTEKFLKQAQEAADGGDNAKAIKLAGKAGFQADAAVKQYNSETAHQRGLH